MFNWIKKIRFNKERKAILSAFPNHLGKDVKEVLNILPLETGEVKLLSGETHKLKHSTSDLVESVFLKTETITIPLRIYFDEPNIKDEESLSSTQKKILNCLYLKHCDGYLRQRRLEKMTDHTESWIAPYTLGLLGDPVFELIPILNKIISNNNLESYKNFILENPKYWQTIKSRVISYWNAYHRYHLFPNLKDYPGKILTKRLDQYTRKMN